MKTNKKKFIIITHSDLDGVGAAVIGKVVFNKQFTEFVFCGYHNVNEKTLDVLRNKEYSHVFITDISVNEEVAEIIDKEYKGKVSLLDHHSNLDYLDKYDWAIVEPGVEGTQGRESGTSLFYKYLLEKCKFKTNEAIANFVEKVRSYDTWDWVNFTNDIEAKQLNDYFGKVGFYDFIQEYSEKLLNNDTELFSELAKKINKYTQKNIDMIVNSKNKSMLVKDIDGYKIGFVFLEIYHSEVGNRLLTLNPNLDAVILIDLGNKKISLRSTDNSKFDCSVIGKKWFGGGGRKNTGGATIPDEIMLKVQNLMFDKFINTLNDGSNEKTENDVYITELSELVKNIQRKSISRQFLIKSKEDIVNGCTVISNRNNDIRTVCISKEFSGYILTDVYGRYDKFIDFTGLQEQYRLLKFLNVDTILKCEEIENISKDLVVKINGNRHNEDNIYGVIRPILYNKKEQCLNLYSGRNIPSNHIFIKNPSVKQPKKHIIIDIKGCSNEIDEEALLNDFYVIKDVEFIY